MKKLCLLISLLLISSCTYCLQDICVDVYQLPREAIPLGEYTSPTPEYSTPVPCTVVNTLKTNILIRDKPNGNYVGIVLPGEDIEPVAYCESNYVWYKLAYGWTANFYTGSCSLEKIECPK